MSSEIMAHTSCSKPDIKYGNVKSYIGKFTSNTLSIYTYNRSGNSASSSYKFEKLSFNFTYFILA